MKKCRSCYQSRFAKKNLTALIRLALPPMHRASSPMHGASSRWYAVATFIAVGLLSGCTICAPGYLDDYATVGGKWQRTNPTSGRVGSPFSDPNYMAVGGAEHETIYHEGLDAGMQFEGEHSYPSEIDGAIIELDGSQSGVEMVPDVIELGDDW